MRWIGSRIQGLLTRKGCEPAKPGRPHDIAYHYGLLSRKEMEEGACSGKQSYLPVFFFGW